MAMICMQVIYFYLMHNMNRAGIAVAKTYADLFGYGAKSRPYQFYHKPVEPKCVH